MDTILHEYKLLQELQSEYNYLINFYDNLKRPTMLVAYYNINVENTDHENKLYSTYDQYHASDIKFDLYDFTPAQYVQPVTNQSSEAEDLDGIRLEGSSTITVYTISRPRINDLIRFYKPIESDEIFRVKDFTTSVSGVHANPPVTWYQLELEYAPIETTEYLSILNHYIYDFSHQKYYLYDEYVQFIKKVKKYQEILERINSFYSCAYDLYKSGTLAPLVVNELVTIIKRDYFVNYKRIFEKYKLPYGYMELFDFQLYYKKIDSFPFNEMENGIYRVYNLESKEIESYELQSPDKYEPGTVEELIYHGNRLLESV